MSDVFIGALRYPFADRARMDGTVMYLVVLLVGGTLLRLATRFWPDLAFLTPALAAVVPPVVFLGLVGGMLAGDGSPPLATIETLKLAEQVIGAVSVYLSPAVVAVIAAGYVTVTGSIPAVLTNVTAAMLATVALLVTIVCAYLFPAATAVSVHGRFRVGLRRGALHGAVSGTYFFAWVGTAVLVVLAWSALTVAISRSVAAPLALSWCAYAHVAAATLIAGGADRATPW